MSVSTSDNKKADTNLQNLSSTLKDSIQKIIKKANYIKYDVKIKTSDGCVKFLSKIYEIDIVGETVDGEKNTHVFVKESIDLKEFTWLRSAKLFPNEVMVYNELSKVFDYLQDQANVPKRDRFRIVKAYEETDNNTIILENLSRRGFKVYEKMERTPFKFAELAVKELAKFHAFSFIIEKKMPEFYKNKIQSTPNPHIFNHLWRAMIQKMCAHLSGLCDDEEKRKIEKLLSIYFEKFPKYHYDQTSVKCTLTHGDFKKNNLMVRLTDGEPEELVIVDYQLIDYGCPIKDLMMFIFTGTDPEFRRKHMIELKNTYFETLSSFLTYFDMDVEAVYPRREFEKVYTEWLDFGLMTSLFVSIFSFASYDGLDLMKLVLTDAPFTPDKNSDHIYRALVKDFIGWGVL